MSKNYQPTEEIKTPPPKDELIMSTKNYIPLNQTGTVNGVKVQCLRVNVNDYEKYKDVGICEYYNCAFRGQDCLDIVRCISFLREDETEVYFKKIE